MSILCTLICSCNNGCTGFNMPFISTLISWALVSCFVQYAPSLLTEQLGVSNWTSRSKSEGKPKGSGVLFAIDVISLEIFARACSRYIEFTVAKKRGRSGSWERRALLASKCIRITSDCPQAENSRKQENMRGKYFPLFIFHRHLPWRQWNTSWTHWAEAVCLSWNILEL